MATTHSADERHPLAGQTVEIEFAGVGHSQFGPGIHSYAVEGWWDGLTGKSWGDSNGNPAAILYAFRAGASGLPWDDEVLYGKIDGMGVLVHTSELKAN